MSRGPHLHFDHAKAEPKQRKKSAKRKMPKKPPKQDPENEPGILWKRSTGKK